MPCAAICCKGSVWRTWLPPRPFWGRGLLCPLRLHYGFFAGDDGAREDRVKLAGVQRRPDLRKRKTFRAAVTWAWAVFHSASRVGVAPACHAEAFSSRLSALA